MILEVHIYMKELAILLEALTIAVVNYKVLLYNTLVKVYQIIFNLLKKQEKKLE